MKQKKNPRGSGYLMYGNKEGYVPNWGGFGLTRATTDREVQHFPQKWQSPLCGMMALNSVNCWKLLKL